MKYSVLTLSIVFIFVTSCTQSCQAGLKIAAFNIQTFGRTKFSNEEVMDYIQQILWRYDLVLIQEIRDSSQSVIWGLLDRLNERNYVWSVEISERLGRSSYKEQYAYYYRNDKLSVSSVYQYDDGPDDGTDWFSREPFGILIESDELSVSPIGLIGIHVAPNEAVEEIDYLDSVYESASYHWGITNILIMGDLNADCSYVSSNDWYRIRLRQKSKYQWLIDDDQDTTVSGSTDCAYDRIVAAGRELQDAVKKTEVFKYDTEFFLDYEMVPTYSDDSSMTVLKSLSILNITYFNLNCRQETRWVTSYPATIKCSAS